MGRRSTKHALAEHQTLLPGFEALQQIPIGRCYTPDALAAAVLDAALSYYDDVGRDYPTSLVEPSVGGGSFLRAAAAVPRLSGCRTFGVDVDPHALGLQAADVPVLGSWPEVAPALAKRVEGVPYALVIGNPPFDSPPEHVAARDHVRATLSHFPESLAAFLLPLGYLGVAGWDGLLAETEERLDIWRVVGRPWPERLREVALFVWRPRWHVHTLGAGGGLRRLPWRS